MFQPVNFFAATDLVVIGTNPEMADFDNPRGELFGVAARVVAEDARGNRRYLAVGVERFTEQVLPKAEAQAAALNARLASGRLPVCFGAWQDDRPAYGSDAYVEYGQADDLAWERDMDERAW